VVYLNNRIVVYRGVLKHVEDKKAPNTKFVEGACYKRYNNLMN